jgi:hypothetical protein
MCDVSVTLICDFGMLIVLRTGSEVHFSGPPLAISAAQIASATQALSLVRGRATALRNTL